MIPKRHNEPRGELRKEFRRLEDERARREPSADRLDLEVRLGVKKCMHLQLRADTHVELRRIMTERGLTMQAIFEEFAQRVIVGDEYVERLMEVVEQTRRDAAMASRTRVDRDALLDLIGRTMPAVEPTGLDEELDE